MEMRGHPTPIPRASPGPLGRCPGAFPGVGSSRAVCSLQLSSLRSFGVSFQEHPDIFTGGMLA